MGEYRDDWFSFEIKSQRHILDLIIEPSFAKAVCFQVHEMENNSFQLFWNFGMVGREIVTLLKEYAQINKIDPKTSMVKVFDSEEFIAFIKQHASGIFIADLDADDMSLVNAVVNANWIEAKCICGLDGSSYKIKIYGEPIREYEFWCYIYEEQKELIPLIDRLIEIAKLESNRIHYEVHGVRNANGNSRKLKPLPPSDTPSMTFEIPDFFWQKSSHD